MRPVVIRYLLTAGALGASAALLSFARPDIDLATELIAERATRAMLEAPPRDEAPAVVVEGGDEACARGARTAVKRLRLAGPRGDDEVTRLRCRVVNGTVRISATGAGAARATSRRLPRWWALLPPLFAVIFALGTRRLLLGLLLSVWLGALLHRGVGPSLGLIPLVRDFLWASVFDRFRVTIVLFTSALVGMANVTTRAAGAKGIANAISRLARGTRSTRLATFLMGVALFFDDYANCIVVGTTMRPLADRVGLSREKLAYIVDSTAAPVAGVAIISTWIGYEVSLFDDLSNDLALGTGGYDLFLQILPGRFYCLLTLVFVLAGVLLSRDFGPMLTAERRAAREGKVAADDAKPLTSPILTRVLPVEGVEPRWQVAAIPVAVVILLTLAGLVWSGATSERVTAWATGRDVSLLDAEYLRQCLQAANGAFVLLVAALAGTVTAFALALTRHREPAGGDRPARRSLAGQVLAAVAVPLAFGLAVVLIHGPQMAPDLSFWSGAYWSVLASRHEVHVVAAAAVLGALLLAVQTIRRHWARGDDGPREYPLTIPALLVTWLAGARAMVMAICILVLAWSIQSVCAALDTSVFLVAALGGVLDPVVLPVIVFLLAAAIAFATGTSWGTMGILIPTAMPRAYHFGGLPLVIISAGAVLDGAIFGDHCSPLSDTTVLSSIASGCDHIHHVRTQLPYALACMVIAVGAYLAVSAGSPRWLAFALGALAIVALLRLVGRPVDAAEDA